MTADLADIRDPLVLRTFLPDQAPLGLCEACDEPTEYPPVCRECGADVEAAKAYREGRE